MEPSLLRQTILNLSLIYSDYYYGLNIDFVGFQWDSGIKNYNIKYDFKNYISDSFKLNYGINGITNLIQVQFDHQTQPLELILINWIKNAFEPSLYLGAEQNVSDKLSVTYGLTLQYVLSLGNFDSKLLC
jgi:hypothetical protein